jgi:hypothetical protein
MKSLSEENSVGKTLFSKKEFESMNKNFEEPIIFGRSVYG